jgi:hypothetical protein
MVADINADRERPTADNATCPLWEDGKCKMGTKNDDGECESTKKHMYLMVMFAILALFGICLAGFALWRLLEPIPTASSEPVSQTDPYREALTSGGGGGEYQPFTFGH